MKKMSIALILISLLSLLSLLSACGKGKTELPSLSEAAALAESSESELLDKIRSRSPEEISAAWGEPNGELFGMWGSIWEVEPSGSRLIVYFDQTGAVEQVKLVRD